MTDDIIEPAPIDDVFCTELVRVDHVGPCLRLTFAVEQSLDGSAPACRTVIAKLIIPAEEAETIAKAILAGPPPETKPSRQSKLYPVN